MDKTIIEKLAKMATSEDMEMRSLGVITFLESNPDYYDYLILMHIMDPEGKREPHSEQEFYDIIKHKPWIRKS